jgi:N-methylhydantoinase B
MLIGHGSEVPNSAGLFGGYEGACNETWLLRGEPGVSHVGQIWEPGPIRASGEELGAKPGFFALRAGDVFGYSFQGGGGYGDPLDRDPALVLADVEEGLVSRAESARLYGVVLDGGRVDRDATMARRAELRARRVPRAECPETARRGPGQAIGPVMTLHAGRLACRCGFDLGPAAGNFKDRAAARVVEPAEHGAIRLHDELELREHCCPSCGTLLESEVVRRGAPSLHTIQLDG